MHASRLSHAALHASRAFHVVHGPPRTPCDVEARLAHLEQSLAAAIRRADLAEKALVSNANVSPQVTPRNLPMVVPMAEGREQINVDPMDDEIEWYDSLSPWPTPVSNRYSNCEIYNGEVSNK